MPYELQQFKQEIDAIQNSLTENNLDSINIFANRIMSNAYILNGERFMLPGFVIKDVNTSLLLLKQSTKSASLTKSKSIMKLFISKIVLITTEKSYPYSKLWKEYDNSFKLLRKELLPENEKKSYENDAPGLTHEAYSVMMKYLKENMDLLKGNNNLLSGMMIEMNRMYQTYGINEKDLKIRALILAVGYIQNYIRLLESNGDQKDTHVEKWIIPFVKKIIDISEQNSTGEESTDLENLLVEMLMLWREMFLRYGEMIQNIPEQQSRKRDFKINLPEETKEKLAKLVTQGLEDQVKRAR